MDTCHTTERKRVFVELENQDAPVRMKFYIGAIPSFISHHSYDTIRPKSCTPPMKQAMAKLQTYTREVILVKVKYHDQKLHLTLIIVTGDGSSPFGQNW